MAILAVTFKNSSKMPDSEVFIGFVSSSPFIISNPNDPGNPILSANSVAGPGNWYSLTDLSAGVEVTSFSGRIYVCYGQAWTVQNANYEPPQNITDPNFFLRYDKMELTFDGDPADVADLTSIDYWAIPMQLDTYFKGKHVQTDLGLKSGVTTQKVFNSLNSLTALPLSGLPNAKPAQVPGQFIQSPEQPGSGFARIIGPSSYPPIDGVPATPYDLFEKYLTFLGANFGPGTTVGASIPGLGNGTIAKLKGEFAGVGPNVPTSGPQSKQGYDLSVTIDSSSNLTLQGTVGSGTESTTMVYQKSALVDPSGIYGANAPFTLNGGGLQSPGNDVYGWVAGDLFSGINIGALGSSTVIDGTMVGAMQSSDWFSNIPNSSLFGGLQSSATNYNQYAATLQELSQAYNFAFSDRFSPVQISLNDAEVDTLQITLLDSQVATPA